MAQLSTVKVLLTLLTLVVVSHQVHAQNQAFDGLWDMQLLCPSHMSKNGRVADAYKISFPVTIKNGELAGSQLNAAPNAGLKYSGTLDAKGKVRISAEGFTGSPKNTLGNSPTGTPYRYTVEANFTTEKGIGTRIEDRPCEAQFFRKSNLPETAPDTKPQ
jgi:hypothetical protein